MDRFGEFQCKVLDAYSVHFEPMTSNVNRMFVQVHDFLISCAEGTVAAACAHDDIVACAERAAMHALDMLYEIEPEAAWRAHKRWADRKASEET